MLQDVKDALATYITSLENLTEEDAKMYLARAKLLESFLSRPENGQIAENLLQILWPSVGFNVEALIMATFEILEHVDQRSN